MTPVGAVRVSRTDDRAAAGAASLVTGGTLLVAFGLLAAGIPWFWVAFPVGFGGVLPAAVDAARHRGRARESGSRPESDGTDAALATLRERYAAGEIDEAAFEARLERLLETETVGCAREDRRRYR